MIDTICKAIALAILLTALLIANCSIEGRALTPTERYNVNRIKLKLDYLEQVTEFHCTTDTECYRDCMDLIDDADACERGLMTND